MRYLAPYILLLIPAAVIAVVFFCISAARKRKRLLNQLLGVNAAAPEALQISYTARRWKYFLYLAAVILIIIGAARPGWKNIPLPVRNSGRDVMVLFDVSKSMRAADLPPSRMEQAKFLLREVISASPGDRFGLIAFAGNAFLSCPLTSDRTALEEYIRELNTDTVPLGGTDIERALRAAQRAFSAAESGHCAVLMLTDGDELTGNSQRLVNDFKKRNIPLIIAGFGDPSAAAPVPDGKGGFMRQSDGTPASSKLNEVSLIKLAAETGGIYIRSTVGDTGSAAIEAALNRLTARERKENKRFQMREEFPWFFAAGFLFILLAAFISEAPGKNFRRINSWFITISALFAALNLSAAPAEAEEQPLPQDALQLYNLARSRQEKNDPSALKLYEEVIRKSANNSELQSRALHNSGVGFHRLGRGMISGAQQQLTRQQLDAALQELNKAKKELDTGKEFYSQVLALDSTENRRAAANMRQLELDRQQLEKLKKQIEELKKQQQKAQQQAQNAAQQNKQQQQQQQQKQQKQQKQQNQQNQQQQNQQQNQIQNAARAARELADKSAQMKQEKLRQDAETARKELEEAARKQSSGAGKDEIQKHLDKAVEALGKPQDEQKKSDGKKGDSKENKPENKPENTAAQQAAERAEAERKAKEKKQAGEQQLQMLNREADKMRQLLRNRNNPGRTPARVEKDW